MIEIKEDATLDQIKAFLSNNNLGIFTEVLDKMRREIRSTKGTNLSLK